MKFRKQMFGFMDMLRFKKLVPERRKALAEGSDAPLPTDYRVNKQAARLHPGYMQTELIEIRSLNRKVKEFTFKRTDSDRFPYFRSGQYISLQIRTDRSIVSRPYSIVSTPKDAQENKLVIAVESSGFVSSFLHEKVSIGDRFIMSEPSGEFYYSRLRDTENVVCIAGGTGVTPFISMAESVADGIDKYNMTLIYGCRNEESIMYREKLDSLSEKGIKVVYVLSDEENISEYDCFEKGLPDRKLIEKYSSPAVSTFFVCGPENMHRFVAMELEELGVEKRRIRRDASCCRDLIVKDPKMFNLKVHMRNEVYDVRVMEYETLLTAMERAGIPASGKCRAGECGFCRSRLISGEYRMDSDRDGRREADRKFGFIHPCATYPLSDMEIDVPPAGYNV